MNFNVGNKWNNKNTEGLAQAVLALRTRDEAKRFLRDLLTEDEILEFGNRFKAAQMLDQKKSYTTISGKTGLSSATIARISSWFQKGMGGYGLIINRLHHHNSSPIGKGLR